MLWPYQWQHLAMWLGDCSRLRQMPSHPTRVPPHFHPYPGLTAPLTAQHRLCYEGKTKMQKRTHTLTTTTPFSQPHRSTDSPSSISVVLASSIVNTVMPVRSRRVAASGSGGGLSSSRCASSCRDTAAR